MKKLQVAKHLSDHEYLILMQVYANHNRNMGLKERVKYSASEIVKVVINSQEKCLEVHYSNGNWWHYSMNGTWY